MYEYRTLVGEFKAEGEAGEFSGYLSVYGNVDSQGEVVDKGAFSRTLNYRRQKGENIPLLLEHGKDPLQGRVPIGYLDISQVKDDEKGLWVKGSLALGMQRARDVYEWLKLPDLPKGLSIGFRTVRDVWEKGVRHLKELALVEGSLVTIGANELALVHAVKGDDSEKAKDGSEVQSLIFPKEHWEGVGDCKKWAKDHGFSADKIDEANDSFRVRQADPGGFTRMRMVCLMPNGAAMGNCKVKAVMGVPKGKSALDEYREAKAAERMARDWQAKDFRESMGIVADLVRDIRDVFGAAIAEPSAREEIMRAVSEVRDVADAVSHVLWTVATPDMMAAALSGALPNDTKAETIGKLQAALRALHPDTRAGDGPDTRKPSGEIPVSLSQAISGLTEFNRRVRHGGSAQVPA